MSVSGPHLTDAERLLGAEGELQASRAAHLFGCGQCLAREQKITAAMASLIHSSHSVDPRLPANNPRALIRERLAQAGRPRASWTDQPLSVVWKSAAVDVSRNVERPRERRS